MNSINDIEPKKANKLTGSHTAGYCCPSAVGPSVRKNTPNATRPKLVRRAIQSSDLRQKMTTLTTLHTIAEVAVNASSYLAYDSTEMPAASRLARAVAGSRSRLAKLVYQS